MPRPRSKNTQQETPPDDVNDDLAAFRAAMVDVIPTTAEPRMPRYAPKPPSIPIQTLLDEKQVLTDSLSDHDPWDAGYETGEELCFLRPGLGHNVLRKLRRGHWIIQEELDLHGLTRSEARVLVAAFLNNAVKGSRRCVRIIHGKGLGSKNREPVLKNHVRIWLMQRDEVLAFCQARPMDGGGGAVIVLLKSA